MARKPTAPATKTVRDDDGRKVSIVAKGANGDGSVFYRESRQRWYATYVDPTSIDPDTGRGTIREALGKTRGEAEAKREAKLEALTARSRAGALGVDPTVDALAQWWLKRVADVRPSTHVSYQNQVRIISKAIGSLPVSALDIEQTRVFLTDLRTEFSDDTVRNVRARLRQIAEEAVTLGYLNSNPVVKVKAPRKVVNNSARRPKRILTPEEVHRLIDAARSHRLGAAVATLLTLGNRSSEVLGLAWSDIDLDAGTATVRRGSTHAGKGVGQQLGETKTVGTAGVHHLPPTVIELLRQRRQVQIVERLEAGPAWQRITYEGEALDMVFTNERGGLVLSQSLYKAMQDCCALAEVDPAGVGTHSGRRAVVTALYAAGLDLADVARHVGHASTTTTAGYVGHLGTRPQDTAAIAASILDPAVSKRTNQHR